MVSPVALPGFEELHIVPDRIEVSSELPPYAITDPQRIGEVLNAIDRVPFYAEDVETDSLDWTRGHLHGMSISTHDQDFYVFEQALEPFLAGLVDLHRRSPNKGVIGHNLKFDLHFLSKYGYRPQMISDTMIAQRTADENVERALKTLAYTRLGYENLPEYKDLLKEAAVYYTCTNTRKCGNKTTYRETGSCPFCGKALAKKSRDMREMTIMDIPRGKLVEYAARDTRLTYDLWPLMKSDLQTESLYDFFFKYEMPFLYVLLDIESNGVYINQAVITQMEKDLLEQAEAARNEWRSIAGEVNYNSPIELPDYLFKTLKLPVQGKTPGGKPSTDALTLMRLEKLDKSGAVSSLLKLREVEKLLGTYIEPLQNVDRNGRKHTSLNQDGAATGRLSSSNPNLQNIPSRGDLGKHIREAFVAADDDHVILVADYSQLELRLVAHMSGEPAMIKVFEAGGDPHQDTADRMSIPRKIAKNINFGSVYGVGPRTLADTIEKTGQPRPSQVDAKRWLQEYDSTYKRLYAWKQEQAALARTQGYVTTLLGRKRRLPEANSFDQSLRNRAERQAFNAPIQGSAADVIQLAMLDVANYTDWYGAKMLLQVHDELVFEVPKSVAEEFGKVVQEKMEGVTQTLGLTVQLKAEPGSGSNWLSAKG